MLTTKLSDLKTESTKQVWKNTDSSWVPIHHWMKDKVTQTSTNVEYSSICHTKKKPQRSCSQTDGLKDRRHDWLHRSICYLYWWKTRQNKTRQVDSYCVKTQDSEYCGPKQFLISHHGLLTTMKISGWQVAISINDYSLQCLPARTNTTKSRQHKSLLHSTPHKKMFTYVRFEWKYFPTNPLTNQP